ncbi:TetR/AcrR family transcriptional regulator [Mycolicibacterium litorale]|uniref:TetR/AcrR family transcriptional regulator n=1 Tax=Mycolicibacterium litorale TaxID=758802 RepID=UPI003CE8CF9C
MKRSGSRSEATAMALVEAALQIIRESGVKSVTHRKVCSYAGVALGSSTYHYENLDNLLLDAFAHYVETVSAGYEKHFEGVSCDNDLIDAVLELVNTLTEDMGNAILEWELLAAAGREEAYRLLGQKWSQRARSAVERYVSPSTAHMIEAIWDGATLQRAFNGPKFTDATLRRLVRAALETDPNRKYPAKAAPAKRPAKKTAKAPGKKPATKRTATTNGRTKAS